MGNEKHLHSLIPLVLTLRIGLRSIYTNEVLTLRIGWVMRSIYTY